jgi:lysyl-tRNA synthetase class 2
MSQLSHIINHKQTIEMRSEIIRAIREFFWSHDFLELETPLILKLPGQEPYLNPMPIKIHDENNQEHLGYLHTSPEYAMKKALAAGFTKIFSLGKCFRDEESFGGTHNPEFTMIEWYRANEDMFALMEDCEMLITNLRLKIEDSRLKIKDQRSIIGNFKRIPMQNLWQKHIGVNLDEYLTREMMFDLCKTRGFNPTPDEKYEDLFYRIFLNEIEPKLTGMGAIFVYNYPAQMAALSRLCPKNPRYAERFELYVNGLELANAFSELTDPVEQKKRLLEEQKLRKKLGKPIFDLDEEFISSLKSMPPAAGIALGIDRLVMLITGCKNINDVLLLPASELFS